MKKNKYAYLVLPVLGAMAAVIALAAAPNGKSVPAFPFTSVTPGQLAPAGITLSSPQAAVPASAVSTAAADSAITPSVGIAAVLETHYMHCVDTTAIPEINQDCYVVSVDPNAATPAMGAAGSSVSAPAWTIVMVDPSGKIIETAGGSSKPIAP